jgi:hypothetical protein
MMKKPKYGAFTMQQQSDARINPFAVQLVAEAHADDPSRFGDETIMVVGRAHNGTAVYMLISTQEPDPEQFAEWPA